MRARLRRRMIPSATRANEQRIHPEVNAEIATALSRIACRSRSDVVIPHNTIYQPIPQ
jgi:hypothetical protein